MNLKETKKEVVVLIDETIIKIPYDQKVRVIDWLNLLNACSEFDKDKKSKSTVN